MVARTYRGTPQDQQCYSTSTGGMPIGPWLPEEATDLARHQREWAGAGGHPTYCELLAHDVNHTSLYSIGSLSSFRTFLTSLFLSYRSRQTKF